MNGMDKMIAAAPVDGLAYADEAENRAMNNGHSGRRRVYKVSKKQRKHRSKSKKKHIG